MSIPDRMLVTGVSVLCPPALNHFTVRSACYFDVNSESFASDHCPQFVFANKDALSRRYNERVLVESLDQMRKLLIRLNILEYLTSAEKVV